MSKKKRDEIPKRLREALRALVDEPIPQRFRELLEPDEPPPTSTPGAAALPVPREETPMPRTVRSR